MSSIRISDLPPYVGTNAPAGDVPISIGGTTYRINPNTLAPLSKSTVTSVRFSGSGQTYNLPTGAKAFKAWINDGVQHLKDPSFPSDINVFTQSGITVTFSKTITTGQRIIIDYAI